jgi:hypothetical protein
MLLQCPLVAVLKRRHSLPSQQQGTDPRGQEAHLGGGELQLTGAERVNIQHDAGERPEPGKLGIFGGQLEEVEIAPDPAEAALVFQTLGIQEGLVEPPQGIP